MKDQGKYSDKRLQGSERALETPYFPSRGFSLFRSVKTCSINAPQRVFSEKVILEYPPKIGGRDDSQTDSLSQLRSKRHWFTVGKFPTQRSPQTFRLKHQVRSVVRIFVPESKWNITLISAQRKGRCEEKNITGFDPTLNASTAPQARLIHKHMLFAEGYMPWGNDGIDTHVGKRRKILVSIHGQYEVQIALQPFPHNRFENSFVRNLYLFPGKRTRKSFKQSLGKPFFVYEEAKRSVRTPGKSKSLFYHVGFSTLPQDLLLLFYNFRKRRRGGEVNKN